MPAPSQAALVRSLLDKGRRLARAGKPADALALCLKAHALDPFSDQPIRAALALYLGQKRHREAKAWLEKLAADRPTAFRAASLLDLLRLDKAGKDVLEAKADEFLNLFPDDADVLLSAGAALQAAGKHEQAQSVYARRLALLPDDAGTLNNLAQCRLAAGDLDGAVSALTRLAAMPGAPEAVRRVARFNLADALLKRGDRDAAERECRALCEAAPDNAAARRLLALIRAARGDVGAALEEARAALEKDRGDVGNWLRLATLTAEKGDLDEAQKLLEQGAEAARHPLPARRALAEALLRRGFEAVAINRLESWHAADPKEAEYALMIGRLMAARGRFAEAVRWLEEAERRDWKAGGLALVRFFEARDDLEAARRKAADMLRKDATAFHHGLYAEVCHSLGRYEESLAELEKGLELEPTNFALTSQKTRILMLREHFAEARACAGRLCRQSPLPRNRLLLLGVLRQSGEREAAIELAASLHEAEPENILWLEEYAAALALDRRLSEATDLLEKARLREPGNLKIARRLLAVYREQERYDDAEKLALSLSGEISDTPEAVLTTVAVLRDMGRLEEGLALCRRGMERYPDNLGLARNTCDFLRRLDRPEEERALVLRVLQGFPPERVLEGCGIALVRIHERLHGSLPDIASPDMQAVIRRIREWAAGTPDNPGIWWAQAAIARMLGRHGDALLSLEAIERRFPDNPDVFSRRADILSHMNKLSLALTERRKALALRPTSVELTQALLDELVKAGDFSEFDSLMARLKHLLGNRRYGYYRNLFFNLNCHPTYSGAQIWEYFRDWYEKSVRPGLPAPKPLHPSPARGRRLRVGYVSPDFRRHSMAYFMEPIFRGQQTPEFREAFEVFCYAHLDAGQKDSYTALFQSLADRWTDISTMSDDDLERAIRRDGIDILIDMAGHTANNRLNLFLRRPAPVQAGWIYGYVQTTGLPQIEWMVCDSQEVPPEHEPFMAESRMARFSFAGHPYAPPPDAAGPEPLPCLQNGYVTFAVTSRPVRVNERCAAAWAAILKAAPTAKIRFQRDAYLEPDIQRLVLERFAVHGIGPERVEFCNVTPLWAAYSAFDCHLDTFPVGYVTTLYEGLWMERPCVSLKARPPMGRVGWGTMRELGLGDLFCAETVEEYVAKAAALGNDPALLVRAAAGLRQRMRGSRLMDYPAFGREIAGLYRAMWETSMKAGKASHERELQVSA